MGFESQVAGFGTKPRWFGGHFIRADSRRLRELHIRNDGGSDASAEATVVPFAWTAKQVTWMKGDG